jgi:hypothetical protein
VTTPARRGHEGNLESWPPPATARGGTDHGCAGPPGKLTCGSFGNGSTAHLAGEFFAAEFEKGGNIVKTAGVVAD